MTRLYLAALAALCVAWLVADRLGGPRGAGVLGGFLLGASLSALSLLHQRRVLRTRPERILAAAVLGFLVKLVVLVLSALALRYVEPLGARLDAASFLIAVGAVVALFLPCGALALGRLRPPRGGSRGSSGPAANGASA
jgi:hypothetical protein